MTENDQNQRDHRGQAVRPRARCGPRAHRHAGAAGGEGGGEEGSEGAGGAGMSW